MADLGELKQHWSQMLVQVARFEAKGKPDEAYARARAIRAEIDAALVYLDDATQKASLGALRTHVSQRVDELELAAQAERDAVGARNAAYRAREQASIAGPMPIPPPVKR